MINKLSTTLFLLTLPLVGNTEKWSRFVISQNRDDVIISFRQMKVNNAWRVQWQVNNKSNRTIEPILKFRHYLCDDGSTLNFTQSTLGIYLPNSQKHGDLIDTKICSNSKIEFVEIETEIIENEILENHDTISPN